MFRLVAGSCLLALLCIHWASASHVHENPHHPHYAGSTGGDSTLLVSEDGATGFSLSSDDAHEEHSAVVDLVETNCAFCRSTEQNEEARPARSGHATGVIQRLAAYPDGSEERASARFARLRPARAPPLLGLS